MTIVTEGTCCLKITLSPVELKKYFYTYKDINYEKPNTREAINNLLRTAARDTNFDFNDGKVLIEVFPTSLGGCIIQLTVSPRTKPKSDVVRLKRTSENKTAYLFEFKNEDDMLFAVKQLYENKKLRSTKSKLFLLQNRYRLLVYLPVGDRNTLIHIGEFAAARYSSKADISYTEEYGSIVCGEKAISKIGSAFFEKVS